MDYRRVGFAIVGFSASFIIFVSKLKRSWHRPKITKDQKLREISLAVEHAHDERLQRSQERHDRIRRQMSTYYSVNKELEEALDDARDALKKAMDFAEELRKMQTEIINAWVSISPGPHEGDQVEDHDPQIIKKRL